MIPARTQTLIRAPARVEIDLEKEKSQGFDIPSEIPADFPPAKTGGLMTISKKGKGQREVVSLTYPLIPKKPKVGEFVYAYAKIYFDNELKKYIYQVFEPPLTPNIKALIKKVKELLEQKLRRLTLAKRVLNFRTGFQTVWAVHDHSITGTSCRKSSTI